MKKKTALIIAIFLLFSGLAGCGKEGNITVSTDGDKARSEFQFEPADTQADTPYRIAVVDIDPYEPASQVFYNFVERLREHGWISLDEIPFRETDEVEEMVSVLASMELGGLVEFDPELCYYMLYEDMNEIESSLREEAKSEEGLGLILGMGTDPGLFVKDLNLDVPLLVPMATDPVASGIIDSAEDSGNSNIWALVEPNPTGRQLKFYHNMIGMKKLGMVVEKESQDIAAIGVYEEAAAKMGIEIVKIEISREMRLETPSEYYAELQQNYKDLVEKEGIDAFLLTIYVIEDPADCEDLFQPFYDAEIPVLVSDGDAFVEGGGLLCVSSFDYRGYGQFAADVAATVFNGKEAGSLPCEYLSSPHIVLNLEVADKIGHPLDFRLLQSCDTLYSEIGGKSGGK